MAPANEVTSTSFFCLLKRTQSETKKKRRAELAVEWLSCVLQFGQVKRNGGNIVESNTIATKLSV